MLSTLLDAPFYEGGVASSGDTPHRLPVALAGHSYLIDLREYQRESVQVIRQQADQSNEPSEQSFNPFALWRRSVETWHHGAGQDAYDLEASDRARFSVSKGIDPWSQGKVSLLNSTTSKRSSANTNLRMAVAGTRLYIIDGNDTRYTTDISGTPTWTAVTGTPAATPTSITTDGYRVWIAYPADIYVTNTGTGAASVFSTQNAQLVAYANGRLLAADGASLYEIDGAGAATLLYTHGASTWTWDSVAAGAVAIYAAGHAGTRGEVYRITVEPTGTALSAPVAAIALPDGEYVTALASYVGKVILGTNKGVRLAEPDGDGNLDYGPLIATTSSVLCLEGEDRFVWFGWTNYDGTSTGLGRLDLSAFTGPLRPAWATDLMVTSTATVLDVTTFSSRRLLAVSGSGFYAEVLGTPVTSGVVDSGEIRWGTSERKTVHNVDLRTEPLPAGSSITLALAGDDETFESLSTSSTAGSTGPTEPYSARAEAAERVQVRLTLTLGSASSSPVVARWTANALVSPPRAERILVPIILHASVEDEQGDGVYVPYDTAAEFRFLKGLESAGAPVVYQEGDESWTVTIEAVRFKPTSWTDRRKWLNGTCSVLLTTIEG